MGEQKVFHTKIKVTPVAKNGGAKFGFTASCKFWTDGKKQYAVEYNQHGDTCEAAIQKVKKFLSTDGADELIEVEE